MRFPRLHFIGLHYGYIIACSLLTFAILHPFGNLNAVDAFFFGVSGSTESGLNTVNVKDLELYQQLCLYFIPHVTNLMFISPLIVAMRLFWFRKHMSRHARLSPRPLTAEDVEDNRVDLDKGTQLDAPSDPSRKEPLRDQRDTAQPTPGSSETAAKHALTTSDNAVPGSSSQSLHVTHAAELPRPAEYQGDGALYVPPPRERDRGQPIVELRRSKTHLTDHDVDAIELVPSSAQAPQLRRRLSPLASPLVAAARSVERITSSAFILGARGTEGSKPKKRDFGDKARRPQNGRGAASLRLMSRSVTVGRNSQFFTLTEEDRDILGGVEYRSLKLLLKIVSAYFFVGHVLGVICLAPWIHNAPRKYTEWLHENGQGKTWWAVYSAQTMFNNLGLTLTPDSMATFRDATWPMLVMTFLALAGNTCYPVLLRLLVWAMSKVMPSNSATQEPLQFLLDHPRRCYTLLFPSRPTWVLFGIVVLLNVIDVTLIITLDLDNPAVEDLPVGPRILSALFQAASSRHTGTSTLSLADLNPAVQFSLVCMMYVAVFPIAISVRASNTYEEQSLGIYYEDEVLVDESSSRQYVLTHLRNQLSFDVWYIFLGTFIICALEPARIMDLADPAFSVFPIFFEVMSAYGNVGLSLGHPSVSTSLSGEFSLPSKLIICALMIRGRHRWLPSEVDRAIMLPTERRREEDGYSCNRDGQMPGSRSSSSSISIPPPAERFLSARPTDAWPKARTLPFKSHHTQ